MLFTKNYHSYSQTTKVSTFLLPAIIVAVN